MLTTLGLQHLVQIAAGAGVGPAPGSLTELATQADRRTTAETMLDAHEALVAAVPENRPLFQDVLAYLRATVQQTGPGGPEKGPTE